MYEDKTLTCKECGAEFVFTAGEQEFYAAKGFARAAAMPVRMQPNRNVKCLWPPALPAEKKRRFRLSPVRIARFTAASALQR